MWIGFMTLIYLKADEVTRDPCSICAEYLGEKVTCSTGSLYIQKRTYFEDGTIEQGSVLSKEEIFGDIFNLSGIEDEIFNSTEEGIVINERTLED